MCLPTVVGARVDQSYSRGAEKWNNQKGSVWQEIWKGEWGGSRGEAVSDQAGCEVTGSGVALSVKGQERRGIF